MATAKTKRTKSPAVTYQVPSTRDECATMLTQMGSLQRRHEEVRLDGESRIAEIKEELAPVLSGLGDQITALLRGMQLWCETHRPTLTNNGAIKTIDLVTGQVGWRMGLYKVSAPQKQEPLVELMKKQGLEDYIRFTPTVNKEAILELNRQVNDLKPDDQSDTAQKLRADLLKLRSIPGLKIERGAEEFFATPAALDAATPTVVGTMPLVQEVAA